MNQSIFIFCISLHFLGTSIFGQEPASIIDISKDWEFLYETNSGNFNQSNKPSDLEKWEAWKKIEKPNNPDGKNNSTIAWFRKKFPDIKNIPDAHLFFDLSKSCEIYLDDFQLYSFGEIGKGSWKGWEAKFIPLPDRNAKYLYVRMYSTSHNIGFHTAKIGSYGNLFHTLVKKELTFFIIGCFYITVGLLTFLIFVYQKSQKIILSFSTFVFFSGVYLISIVNPLSRIYLDSPLLWPYMMYSSLFLLPVSIISFTEEMIGQGIFSITRKLILTHFIFAIVSLAISFFGIVHLESTLPIFQILLLFSVAVHFCRISYHAWKGNVETRIFSIGAICYIATVIIDVLRAIYTNTAFDGITQWGAALFIFSLIVILNRRFMAILEKTKAHAAELENKVRERTEKLHDSLLLIKKDLTVAKKIQTNILPTGLDRLEKVKIHSLYSPMSEVGGDFFDVNEVEKNVFRILLADATGHGVQGALITIAIKGEYEGLKWIIKDPAELLEILNREFYNKYRSLNSFFSCFIIDIDLNFQTFSYTSAGHPDQLFIQNGKNILLPKTGKLGGMLKESEYSAKSYSFKKEDRLFLFSDGAFEQFNSDGAVFGEQRLYNLLSRQEKLEKIPEIVMSELKLFLNKNKMQDDATFLSIEFLDSNQEK